MGDNLRAVLIEVARRADKDDNFAQALRELHPAVLIDLLIICADAAGTHTAADDLA